MDNLKKLLKEACPNHVFPIKHNLRDCNMMKNFMISGSLTRGMELNEVPDESDTIPFLGEATVMMVYGGHLICARVWDMREQTFLWPDLLVGSQELDNYWFET
jgi:hypothetical protein